MYNSSNNCIVFAVIILGLTKLSNIDFILYPIVFVTYLYISVCIFVYLQLNTILSGILYLISGLWGFNIDS